MRMQLGPWRGPSSPSATPWCSTALTRYQHLSRAHRSDTRAHRGFRHLAMITGHNQNRIASRMHADCVVCCVSGARADCLIWVQFVMVILVVRTCGCRSDSGSANDTKIFHHPHLDRQQVCQGWRADAGNRKVASDQQIYWKCEGPADKFVITSSNQHAEPLLYLHQVALVSEACGHEVDNVGTFSGLSALVAWQLTYGTRKCDMRRSRR